MIRKIVRNITIYHIDHDDVVEEIIITNEQFEYLKSKINNTGDPNVYYIYDITLKDCLSAGIKIPNKYYTNYDFQLDYE
ncbi:hypothetical protein QJU43_09520 [Pasteurella atlantica]|uniref:hypothetical protein n=1 Tax=Pasteurellaceae TaxID=712 RepID=UPI00276A8E6E|nr:hypothetical protein [Pasteurella atlantica]MDP8034508.1 hypothetical protein [Pasteurella atlantica]MDP8036533.1 hypothetical protein [Pasteurella atlantica]MDP8038393.1 hypothetical protein [Pasteurella atlantica]MDP8048749.1 hypothetical protein [Pasteurella atlantica]MDP8050706.1 hypothetical protein [Pasteurella atlantica]